MTKFPTDEQIDDLWDEIGGYFNLYDEVRNTVREALNRWGNPEQKEKSGEKWDAEDWGANTPIVPDETMEELLKNGKKK